MAEKIKLVQGDTRPQLKYVVSDETTGQIVDLTGATVLLKFRAAGSKTVLFTLTGYLQSGIEDENGVVSQYSVGETYAVPGSGGRVAFQFGAGNLNIDPGQYEGELEVTFNDSSIQTVYSVTKFQVRAQF
jgi:hypothetical protein